MRIVPRTNREYAHIELDTNDEQVIGELQKTILARAPDFSSLRGLRIEISEHDQIPQDTRRSLIEGKYFLVQ